MKSISANCSDGLYKFKTKASNYVTITNLKQKKIHILRGTRNLRVFLHGNLPKIVLHFKHLMFLLRFAADVDV